MCPTLRTGAGERRGEGDWERGEGWRCPGLGRSPVCLSLSCSSSTLHSPTCTDTALLLTQL